MNLELAILSGAGGWLALAVGAVVAAGGCVPYTRAELSTSGRFEPLYERKLSTFEHGLALDRRRGVEDPWTRLGEAWLRFANCQPVRAEDAPGSGEVHVARYLRATVVLEDVRRRLRAAYRAVGRPTPTGAVLYREMAKPEFFDRQAPARGEDTVEWPAEAERWADELPAAIEIESACKGLDDRVLGRAASSESEGDRGASGEEGGRELETLHGWHATYIRAVRRVLRRYRRLPEQKRAGRLRAVQRRARVWSAAVAYRFAQVYERSKVLEAAPEPHRRTLRPERLWRRVGEFAEPVAAPDELAGLPEPRRAQANVLMAVVLQRRERPEAALEHVDRALSIGVAEGHRWAVRYLRVRLLTDLERWKKAAQIETDALPPRNSRYFSPYLYRVAYATQKSGQRDRFLGIAKYAFRDRAPQSGPFERALYKEVLRTLATYPFEQRIVELLEELGPRSRTHERVEQLARTSLESGRVDNAEAAARWLLGHSYDARKDSRYRGILAMAAFLRDDPAQFREQLREIGARPDRLREAIPRSRRAAFFADNDAEVARILRRTLPLMAEWGRTSRGRARRKKWLEIIVEETQGFLRRTDETVARPKLVELYRLASSLLEKHPRGYAERVGDSGPAPLVLGTVRVEKPDLGEHEPPIRLSFEAPYSLTLVPRDEVPPAQWPLRWNETQGGSDA